MGLLRHFFDTISLFGPLDGVFVVLSWECCNNCCIFCNKISVSSAIPGSVIGSGGVTSSDVMMVGKTVIVFCSAKNSRNNSGRTRSGSEWNNSGCRGCKSNGTTVIVETAAKNNYGCQVNGITWSYPSWQ